LIVDLNAVLPGPITLRRLQTIFRRRIQFIDPGDRIDLDESTDRYPSNRIPAPALSGLENGSGLLVRKTSDQLRYCITPTVKALLCPEPGHTVIEGQVQRRERLGGLLNYYYRKAA
jgi:hypothetical protein